MLIAIYICAFGYIYSLSFRSHINPDQTQYFQRINPQLLNIEYSSEIGGIIIEEEEILVETREFYIPSRPQRRMNISYIIG